MEYQVNEIAEQFFSLSKQMKEQNEIGGREICNQVVEFYKNSRVINTDLSKGDDMLLLQWETTYPYENIETVDFRSYKGNVKFALNRSFYLDFTRQIFSHKNDKIKFDDAAIQLHIILVYGEVPERIRGGNMWINSPSEIEEKIEKYYQEPFVLDLIDQPITKMITTLEMPG
jgi:hypothetical protein